MITEGRKLPPQTQISKTFLQLPLKEVLDKLDRLDHRKMKDLQ